MPNLILHVDGDSFFASCEMSLDPRLRGKPVVTGLDRGIASAMSYEAKARGIHRGMPLWEIRKVCPDVIILPSDYDSYVIFSRRMFDIVKRYSVALDTYSIDECFAELHFSFNVKEEHILEKVRAIKNELQGSLGMTFSLGVASTKTLAKTASKWKKPDGLTLIQNKSIAEYLKSVPIEDIWGIGRSTSVFLSKRGVRTGFDFISKPQEWVLEFLSKPYVEIWQELRGIQVSTVGNHAHRDQRSISKTETFKASRERSVVLSELSKNAESACAKARKEKLKASSVSFYLKTQEFSYQGAKCTLLFSASDPEAVMKSIYSKFDSVYKAGVLYRATGITLYGLRPEGALQPGLFSDGSAGEDMEKVYEEIDSVSSKYGKRLVFLAGSLLAKKREAEMDREMNLRRREVLFLDRATGKRLSILMMGETD